MNRTYILAMLNEMVEQDPAAMLVLVGCKVPCNEGLRDFPGLPTGYDDGAYNISMLGVLSALLAGCGEDGISFMRTDSGRYVFL